MLLSALFSDDLGKGLKNWADLWIWRMMPFVIMVLALNEYAKAKKVMLAAFLGIAVESPLALGATPSRCFSCTISRGEPRGMKYKNKSCE